MPDIKLFTGKLELKWEKVGPRKPKEAAKCYFCSRAIMDTEVYQRLTHIMNGEVALMTTATVFVACQECATEAGVQW